MDLFSGTPVTYVKRINQFQPRVHIHLHDNRIGWVLLDVFRQYLSTYGLPVEHGMEQHVVQMCVPEWERSEIMG